MTTIRVIPQGMRHDALIVRELGSRSSGLGWSPSCCHCAVFFGKTLDSHSASLHPSVIMGTGEFNARRQSCDGLASHPEGSRNTPSRFMQQKLEICADLMGH